MLGDVNGDGKADLVAIGQEGSGEAGWVKIGFWNGNGFPLWSYASHKRVFNPNDKVMIGDVNGDGKADLMAIGQEDGGEAGWIKISIWNGKDYPMWSWVSRRRLIG